MEIGSPLKATLDIPEYVYYIIGFMIVSHFGSLITFFGVVLKWVVEYKIQARDIATLRDQTATLNAAVAKAQIDLNVAHERIREMRSLK